MRSYHNIEKSVFHAGRYIGWDAGGNLYHITKLGKGWYAQCQEPEDYGYCSGVTLADLSRQLEHTNQPARRA